MLYVDRILRSGDLLTIIPSLVSLFAALHPWHSPSLAVCSLPATTTLNARYGIHFAANVLARCKATTIGCLAWASAMMQCLYAPVLGTRW